MVNVESKSKRRATLQKALDLRQRRRVAAIEPAASPQHDALIDLWIVRSLQSVEHRLLWRLRSPDLTIMTAQASKILRAFARGEPIMRIADTCGISYTQAWSQLKRAVAKTEHKNPSPLDTIRLEQYFILTRIVDQAFEAFEKTIKGTARGTTVQTIETTDANGKLGLIGSRVTAHVRGSAGNIRYLEIASLSVALSSSESASRPSTATCMGGRKTTPLNSSRPPTSISAPICVSNRWTRDSPKDSICKISRTISASLPPLARASSTIS